MKEVTLRVKLKDLIEKHNAGLPEEERLNQNRLAEALGRHPSVVSRYVLGNFTRADMTMLEDIAAFFGVEDANDLFELETKER